MVVFAAQCSLSLQDSVFSGALPLACTMCIHVYLFVEDQSLQTGRTQNYTNLFLSWIISQTLLKREWGEGAAGLKSSSRNSFKACKHVLPAHLIHLLPSRLSLRCRGRGFICWVTVWEHMRLGLPAASPTIKSAGSQVRTLN